MQFLGPACVLPVRSSSISEHQRHVCVALGSNQGPRHEHLRHAVARLQDVLTELHVSSFLETAPEGTVEQPDFLNGVVTGWSSAEPELILNQLQSIEIERGRVRPFPGAPRTLDLDLILVGDLVVNTTKIVLPHPRFRLRRFVLEPLAEVAPTLVDPVSGRTIQELLTQLRNWAPSHVV